MKPILIEVPTIFESMTVNCWLIKEPEPVLIDCGEKTEAVWEALNVGLKKEGLTIGDLKKVIITHAHLDHVGMAHQITQHSDAEIWISEPGLPWTDNLKGMLDARDQALIQAFGEYIREIPPFKFGYKQLSPYWDEIPADRVKTFPLNGNIEIGGESWEVIHAPGHCINQTCFFHRQSGQLFSGDALMEIIPPPIIDMSIEPPFERTQSMAMMLQTFQKLSELPIKTVYPGHLNIIENVDEVIRKQIKRIIHRKELCYQFIQEGMDNFYQLQEKIYPKRKVPPTFLMILGFLDLLKAEGKIAIERESKRIVCNSKNTDGTAAFSKKQC
ncbi:MAG: MBL fold metallo-hydrolase [Bacteroidetes bacterium]|nr:MBL fold metallo-hydrolase [Bacteroidota bacterium]